MADKNVVVYSTPTWPWCTRVKEYLSQKNVTYTEYDVAQDKEKAREMVEKSKQMGVPVVMVDDDIVVGFNQAELEKLLAE